MNSINQNQVSLSKLENTLRQLLEDKKREFYQLGEILAVIKKNRLYKDNYSNFGLYCKEKWDLGVSYSNYLVKAYEVINDILQPNFSILPNNERHVRLFSSYPKEDIIKIWGKTLELSNNDVSNISSNLIKEAINNIFPPTINKETIKSNSQSIPDTEITKKNPPETPIKEIIQPPLFSDFSPTIDKETIKSASQSIPDTQDLQDSFITEKIYENLKADLVKAFKIIPKENHPDLINFLKKEIEKYLADYIKPEIETAIAIKPEIETVISKENIEILNITPKSEINLGHSSDLKSEPPQNKENLDKYITPLTDSQKTAFLAILDFIKGKDRYYKLTGYAGTGKSYLIVQLIKYLTDKKKNFIVASPTNKAVKNIIKLGDINKIAIDATTLAKLLSILPEINEVKGNEIFVSYEPDKSLDYDIIFIDEYSMVSKDNLDLLHKKALESFKKPKIIFVGDSAQLPPINEQLPPVDNFPKIKSKSELTEIIRYSGAIALVGEKIRTNSEFNSKIYPFETSQDNSIICLPRKEWGLKACELINSKEFKENSNFARVLVWRNKTASHINSVIRKNIFGDNCKPFEIGDILIAKTPVFRLAYDPRKNKPFWAISMNNSEECRVTKEAKLTKETISLFDKDYDFDFWAVPVLTDGNVHLDLRILTGESQLYLEKIKKDVKDFIYKYRGAKKGLWEKYQILEKNYDNCPHAYAITTHKAQGSSINHVFIDVADLRGCSDLQKIQYTAFTRAIDCVYIPE